MLKNKKITILQSVDGQDEAGFNTEKWEPLPNGENIWAYYRSLSGKEFFAAGTTNSKVEVLFQIAWHKDIKTYHKIRYKGKDYYITRIDDFEGNKNDLKIYAYAIN